MAANPPPAADTRPSSEPQDAANEPSASRRQRRLFIGLVVVCVAGAAIAIAAATGQRSASAPASARELLTAARAAGDPLVIFRAAGGARVTPGQVMISDLDRVGAGSPAPMSCDRVHFAGDRGLCVARGQGFGSGYRAAIFGPDLAERGRIDLPGTPSRARVSPDGRIGAITQFVTGHSYAEAGSFSTSTTLVDLASAEKIAELESFSVVHGERFITAVDVNFWGVTFARDSDRFLATLATGGKTYLVRGSVSGRQMRVLHENVECPSLSPDGTRIAFKKRVGSGSRPWRLTVLELDTMHETPLAERRGIDDQVEWLDDRQVLYGMDDGVWTARADGSGRPRRFLEDATSPAVVRW